MTTLIPVHASNHVLEGITEYLATTFALANQDTAQALKAFLEDPESGMFHGPYVRTRLPYARAVDWENLLGWLPSWFKPYHHQAEAFRRLRSIDENGDRRPLPTLVITGTGSGKTEAFLYPVLDHARRMHQRGQQGVKALLLYPMNALANDQASRLANLLTTQKELAGVTAGIYTGEASGNATKVSKDSLITSRDMIRDNPPDILLTNYKMLDQLLLRPEDRKIWRKSAHSLQYLVLDEFHTYDGAQGTDVALLLRRLGLQVKKYQREGFLDDETSKRPLGKITPVATSATLGGKEDFSKVRGFAETIFGEEFDESALVGERVLSYSEWSEEMAEKYGCATESFDVNADVIRKVVDQVAEAVTSEASYDQACLDAFSGSVFGKASDLKSYIANYAAHPLTKKFLEAAAQPVALMHQSGAEGPALPQIVLGTTLVRLVGESTAVEFLTHLLTVAAALRSRAGEQFGREGKRLPGVETHLWVREISRIDRAVTPVEDGRLFRWADDGVVTKLDDSTVWLPACYCRKCGRAGWMAALEPGTDVPIMDGPAIRRTSVDVPQRQRVLLDATNEYRQGLAKGIDFITEERRDNARSFLWLHTATRELSRVQPSDEALAEGLSIPVLTFTGQHAEELSAEETCPSCGEFDSIRYIGSAVATLLSVGLSNLFGMADLDGSEKKTLVFADSVQDAAHRAGFVQSRSHAFGLRTFMYNAVEDEPIALSDVPLRMVQNADNAGTAKNRYHARFDLLPAEIAHIPGYMPFWDESAEQSKQRNAEGNARDRLAFDLALEFGQRADLPRSLVQTGALTVAVDVSDEALESAARVALDSVVRGTTQTGDRRSQLQWARGLIEQIRERGGIDHPWLKEYLAHDGNAWFVNNRTAKSRGVPSFPPGGSPEFPRSGKKIDEKDRGITPLGSPRGRYAQWTQKLLGISTHDAAAALTNLFQELSQRGVLSQVVTQSGGIIYALKPRQIVLTKEDSPHILECDVCSARLGVNAKVRALLNGMPCVNPGCAGRYGQKLVAENYYKALYKSGNVRSVVAAEHTGLIPKDQRLALERTFRGDTGIATADSPNVLVATPTLEMGIDIGDLSSVMLSSLPLSVAHYVQRVGRAGRLTGNSLVLAFVRGRGNSLPKLNDPLSVIAGSVEPPAAFLSATEILHRQLMAYIIDSTDFDALDFYPKKATSVFSETAAQTPLVDLLKDELIEKSTDVSRWVEEFLSTLASDHVEVDTLAEAGSWATRVGPDSLAGTLDRAQEQWDSSVRLLTERKKILEVRLKELESLNKNNKDPNNNDEQLVRELRSAKSSHKRVQRDLQEIAFDEHWVSAMERFGLLPNFALLDDSVELSISVTTLNPLTLELEPESFELTRGVASALQEFAPGATFYARGIEATIDSVELGEDSSDIITWRLCPACSYAEPETKSTPSVCPACKDPGFADKGQLINAVKLKKVSASVDRSNATIDGRSENRITTFFHTTMSFSVPKGGEGNSWYLKGGFGARYLRTVEITWFNLGKGRAVESVFAGKQIQSPLFSVCRHCGHLDSALGVNSKWDHRPWCPNRNQRDEDTISVALSRTLRTQGVLLYIPAILTAGDTTTIPSLCAAILLGFKEVFGGDPSHLKVEPVRVPTTTGGAVEALLLHDDVPGGTGYLSQFANPDSVRTLLLRAYDRVASCSCSGDERLACPQCLLPYARPRQLEITSRAAAQRALFAILMNQDHPDANSDPHVEQWEPQVEAPPIDDASKLELRFREELRAGLESRGATINQRPTPTGMDWQIRFPNNEEWLMREQVGYGYTIPDFLFTHRTRRRTRDVAVFTDGYAYHGSVKNFRFPSDMSKRVRLAGEGLLPWSITHRDLDWFDGEVKGTAVGPSWKSSEAIRLGGQLPLLSSESMELILSSPLTQLLYYLEKPTDEAFASYGEGLVRALVAHSAPVKNEKGEYVVRHAGGIDLVIEMIGGRLLPTKLTIDVSDHDLPLDPWNDYLRFANVLFLSDEPIDVTTSETSEEDLPGAQPVEVEVQSTTSLVPEWAEAIEEFADEGEGIEKTLLAFARAGASSNFVIGEELHGLATIVQWPDRQVALLFEEEHSVVEQALLKEGWTLLTPETVTDEEMRKVLA